MAFLVSASQCMSTLNGVHHDAGHQGQQHTLALVHVDFTSVESTMELNKPPSVKNVLVITDHFTRYTLAIITNVMECDVI